MTKTLHEYCVTYAKEVDGETVEVHHGHCEASSPEEACLIVAVDGTDKGIDMDGCDAMVRVIMRPPADLMVLLRTMRALGATATVVRDVDPNDVLSSEAIMKGVADSVGGKFVDGAWTFESPEAEVEFRRRLATVAAPAKTSRGGHSLH